MITDRKVQVNMASINPVHGMNPFKLALGSELIIDLMERISYQREVTALPSSCCGSVVIGKVLQINMARINPRP